MSMKIHTLRVVLTGVWLGGVIFTRAAVSPSLEAKKRSAKGCAMLVETGRGRACRPSRA